MSEAGRCAVVQGASRGLGLALARRLSEDSTCARVFATCRRPDEARDLQGAGIDVLRVDVTDEASIAAAAATVAETVGAVDLLINVAGVLHGDSVAPEKRLESITPYGLARAFQVNAFGPLLVLKHFHPLLKHDRRAVVANVSARVGSIGDNRLGGWYAYRGSKAALNMFTRTASIELGRKAPNAIAVAIHPGTVDTALSRPFQKSVPPERLFAPDRAARQILEVLDGLGPEQTGTFVAWDGSEIPW